MLQYGQGNMATFYANFLTIDGKEPTSVVNPVITIRHIDGTNTLVTDINEQPMTFATESLYYFKWNIPVGADLGEYTAEFQATVDGEYAEANEEFQVVSPGAGAGAMPCGNYTTAEKVANYLGVDVSSIQEDWLEWATAYIETYTCQRFCPTTVTEKYDIEYPSQEMLFLDHYPILSVTELKDDGDVVPPTDYLVYEDIGKIAFADEFTGTEINLLQPGPFTYGRQRVEVTYIHGYANVPKEIEWAATVLTAYIGSTALRQSGTLNVGDVIEEEIGEYRRRKSESTSGSTSFDLSTEGAEEVEGRLEEDVFSAKNVLRMYRNRKMRAV